jgi:hypothetical protein
MDALLPIRYFVVCWLTAVQDAQVMSRDRRIAAIPRVPLPKLRADETEIRQAMSLPMLQTRLVVSLKVTGSGTREIPHMLAK